MIGYVTLGSNNLDKARDFYAGLLAVLGGKEVARMDSGMTMYGAGPTKPMVIITKPYDGKAATVGNGTMVSLLAETRAQVDAAHAKAMSLGAPDEGKPGLRGPEGPRAFYGAYFRDPDGNKLCVFKMGPDK